MLLPLESDFIGCRCHLIRLLPTTRRFSALSLISLHTAHASAAIGYVRPPAEEEEEEKEEDGLLGRRGGSRHCFKNQKVMCTISSGWRQV
jgi:hypothetical protein